MADDTSLKDDLTAAFDAAEKAPEPTPEPTPEAVVAPSEPIGEKPQEGKGRDDKGRFVAPEKAKIGGEKAPPKGEETPKAPVEAKAPAEPTPNPEPERPKVRAPASWKPTAREGWDKVPADVQQEVIRREREITATLNETAEARQTYQKFKETVSPYEPMIRAEGVDSIQAVGNLLRTAAQLATGPVQTKAQIVAGLIRTYGVDVQMLANLLEGQPVPQQQPQYQAPGPAQFRDPRLDALLEQQQSRVQQQAATQLQEVEQEEWFEDVREDMADLLEVAAKRGFALSARDAYNRAVALHPEVSRVVEQRRAAATQGNGATQRALAASSSVRGQPTASPPAPAGGSLRDDLEAALDRLSNRRT